MKFRMNFKEWVLLHMRKRSLLDLLANVKRLQAQQQRERRAARDVLRAKGRRRPGKLNYG